jgi:hypothetical protein
MYLVNNIDQIHHLLNESKKLIFAYNSDRWEYNLETEGVLNLRVVLTCALRAHIKKPKRINIL